MRETSNVGAKIRERRRPTTNVLIVDKDPQLAQTVLRVLARKGIRGIVAQDTTSALRCLDRDDYQLVFSVVSMAPAANPGQGPKSSAGLLKTIRLNVPELPVVMIAEPDTSLVDNSAHLVEAAVQAVRAGYCDFLVKPVSAAGVEAVLERLLPNRAVATLDSAEKDTHSLYQIVGRSPKLVQTIELAKRVAPTSAPVLVSGETGTGKELISYMIHQNSKRSTGPYVRVNCAALSESLLESELFGHEKGAFTGAYVQRKGRFEMAHGGTLLLDEITETPPRFQAKLLRILDQQDFERVGGNENIKVNVRIISTTNKDLAEEVAEQKFRADLYYRLSTVRLMLAPLRERTEDLQDLIWHFVNLHAYETNRRITSLDAAMIEIFRKYHWPGNVRQLRNVIRTSMILGSGPALSLADVSWLFDELQCRCQKEICQTSGERDNAELKLGGVPLVQLERRAILETLRQTDGNQSKAAKVLGISDRTLRCKIKKYRDEGVLTPV